MQQFSLELDISYERPVVTLRKFHNLDALVDTGARFPVWVVSEKRLKSIGALKVRECIEFGGFGGKAKGTIYQIPLFQFGDLMYPYMNIIACELTLPVPLILPATMFNNLIYEINNKTHRLNITVPDNESNVRNLTIKDDNGRLHVFCTSSEKGKKEIYL